jgi:hypothetical protein
MRSLLDCGHLFDRSGAGQMMRRLEFILLLVFSMQALTAQAERTIDLAPYSVPSSGTVVIAVSEGVPQSGAFAEVDAVANGALRQKRARVATPGPFCMPRQRAAALTRNPSSYRRS